MIRQACAVGSRDVPRYFATASREKRSIISAAAGTIAACSIR
jgi:hypothetical protein